MVEQQLIAAANGGTAQQKAFESFILDETLFVATPEAGPEGTVTLQVDTNVSLMMVGLQDGRQATAIFSSPQRIHAVFGEVGYLGIPGRTLFEMIRANPAFLNPGYPYGVVWEPASLSALIGLPAERVVAKETQVMLGHPSDPPTELIASLRAAFAAVPQVQAAWLALAAWPEEGTQSWYLDVRTASPDHGPIRDALPGAIEDADLKGRPVDMIINPVGGTDGAGIPIITPAEPQKPSRKKGLLGRLCG